MNGLWHQQTQHHCNDFQHFIRWMATCTSSTGTDVLGQSDGKTMLTAGSREKAQRNVSSMHLQLCSIFYDISSRHISLTLLVEHIIIVFGLFVSNLFKLSLPSCKRRSHLSLSSRAQFCFVFNTDYRTLTHLHCFLFSFFFLMYTVRRDSVCNWASSWNLRKEKKIENTPANTFCLSF